MRKKLYNYTQAKTSFAYVSNGKWGAYLNCNLNIPNIHLIIFFKKAWQRLNNSFCSFQDHDIDQKIYKDDS